MKERSDHILHLKVDIVDAIEIIKEETEQPFLLLHCSENKMSSLATASLNGNLPEVSRLIENNIFDAYNSNRADALNAVLGLASSTNHLLLVRYAIAQGATDIEWAFIGASIGGHLAVIKYLHSFLPSDVDIGVLNRALSGAVSQGWLPVAQFLVERGASNLEDAIRIAESYGDQRVDILEYLKSL